MAAHLYWVLIPITFLPLVEASKKILKEAIMGIRAGSRVAHVGKTIHEGAKAHGYTVIHDS
ncbi:MAG: hypothetical protein R2769_06090 [Saprospiraceae bacterium]